MLRTFAEGLALVTGGASGIGAALGRELARRGARVVLLDRDGDEAQGEAARITVSGGRAEAATLDVRDASAVAGWVADVFARHGRLDYLFNNAGIAVGGEVRDLRLEDWRDAVEVNLIGVVHGVQAAMAAPYGATKSAVRRSTSACARWTWASLPAGRSPTWPATAA